MGNTVGQFIPRCENPCKISVDAEFKFKSKSHSVSFAYIPADITINDLKIPNENNHTYFIFSEAPLDLWTNSINNILIRTDKELFFQLDDWFREVTGGQI